MDAPLATVVLNRPEALNALTAPLLPKPNVLVS
jgi:enoyl-CoA hydratase/carnithine racemase